jgi:diadenosine tetraphosphate (Ap4A) HIT family hydrolase
VSGSGAPPPPAGSRGGAGGCIECRIASGQEKPSGLAPLRRGPFLVHPRPDPSPLAGWFIVAPARHVEQIDALDAAEAAVLGPLLTEVAAALRAETPCEKVYVSLFAEVVPHVHVHVIARPPGLAPDARGARVFLAEPAAHPAEVAALARRVIFRLSLSLDPSALPGSPASSAPAAPSGSATGIGPARPLSVSDVLRSRLGASGSGGKAHPLRAALLSGLVWPGLGQIVNGQIAKGMAFGLLVLAVAAFLVKRLVGVVLAAVPPDTTSFDVFQALDIANEVQRKNAGSFNGAVMLLLAIWVVSVVDAYWSARPAKSDGRR